MVDALRSRSGIVPVPDTGSLRDDLTELTTTLYRYCCDPAGWAKLRISIDAAGAHERLGPFARAVQEVHSGMVAQIMARAVERGEADPSASPVDVAEVLFGTVVMQVLASRLDGGELDKAEIPARTDRLIKTLFQGVLTRVEPVAATG
ncbi:TetR-like C-terminal domain-containing protein [Streptomyces sp. NPDC004561]